MMMYIREDRTFSLEIFEGAAGVCNRTRVRIIYYTVVYKKNFIFVRWREDGTYMLIGNRLVVSSDSLGRICNRNTRVSDYPWHIGIWVLRKF